MKLKTKLSVTLVAIALFAAVSAAASPKDAKAVTLRYDVTVAGSHLTSGDYKVTWQTHSPAATVSFLKNGKVVATTDGKVVDRGTKCLATEVVYAESANGGRQIQEIRFRGSSEAIVFSE